MIKISVCCITYNRPHLLGEMIQSFLMQDYPKDYCELIILDDGGQYGDIRGDNWQIVSFSRRFGSLCQKRNACISLSSREFTHLAIADDDDIYLPWWLAYHARNFERGSLWSSSNQNYISTANSEIAKQSIGTNGCVFHPGHAFAKSAFWQVGGYSALADYDDLDLFHKLRESGIIPVEAINYGEAPFLIYRRFPNENHMSCVSLDEYNRTLAPSLSSANLDIGWKIDYLKQVEEFERQSVNI